MWYPLYPFSAPIVQVIFFLCSLENVHSWYSRQMYRIKVRTEWFRILWFVINKANYDRYIYVYIAFGLYLIVHLRFS